MSTWRTNSPPRGVRCLVTVLDGGHSRVLVASVSPDFNGERWFSAGTQLDSVIAWMPCPEPAEAMGEVAQPAANDAAPPARETLASVQCALESATCFLESLIAESISGTVHRLKGALEGVQRALAYVARGGGAQERDLAAAYLRMRAHEYADDGDRAGADALYIEAAHIDAGVHVREMGPEGVEPAPSANTEADMLRAGIEKILSGRVEGMVPSGGLQRLLDRFDATHGAAPAAPDDLARLRARWDAARPFVDAVVEVWNEADVDENAPIRGKFDRALVRALLKSAMDNLGALHDTFSEDEVRESLRAAGGDPDAIGKRGVVLVGELLRMRRERSGAYAAEPIEPDVTEDEVLDLYYIANRDNDARVQALCELAREGGETARRIARHALQPLAVKRRAAPR